MLPVTNHGPGEPDETQPFTHRPYGDRSDDQPFVSPSGPDQTPPPETPAWPTYGQPSAPSSEPPTPPPPPPYGSPPAGPPNPYLQQPQQPYGQAPYGQQGYVPPNFAGYGQPVPGYNYAQAMGKATTAMVLGIIGIASIALTPFCCITLPGMFVAPFAIWLGASAKKEIDRNPAAYNNRGQAVAGFVMGIVGTVLAVLVIIVIVLFVGMTDWSSSYDGY
jgi:hypothetical protein